jgi:hypothetical protein
MTMKTFYVVRSGWNSANQSAAGSSRNPKNQFDSNQLCLVGIIDAPDAEAAIAAVGASCYNGQSLFAVTRRAALKGLTQAVRQFFTPSHNEWAMSGQ